MLSKKEHLRRIGRRAAWQIDRRREIRVTYAFLCHHAGKLTIPQFNLMAYV